MSGGGRSHRVCGRALALVCLGACIVAARAGAQELTPCKAGWTGEFCDQKQAEGELQTQGAVQAWTEDTVHILLSFCGGNYVTTEKMGPYLRSLLFHRSCKVHFHVMTDRAARASTQKLFQEVVQHRFAQVEVTFVPTALNDKWLAKAQGMQRFTRPTLPACSLVRIWADQILPHLDAVIVMDANDEIVLGDIADLWTVFAEFDDDDLIGSALEQTSHYNKYVEPGTQYYDPNWAKPPFPGAKAPLDEWGFNCGVLLMNLTRLRADNWSTEDMAGQLANEGSNLPERAPPAGMKTDPIPGGKGLRAYGFLGENDIWQYAVMRRPHILHKIPCYWDIILYAEAPGLAPPPPPGMDWYKGRPANPGGSTCTPIRIMHGTGGSFKRHELGAFHRFYRDGLDQRVWRSGHDFRPKPIEMAPGRNALAVAEDPHRSRHDRRLKLPKAAAGEEVHIMMFVCGKNYADSITAFLRQIIFHRSTALHFYFVADSDARPGLKNVWNKLRKNGLTDVMVTYVKAEKHIAKFEKDFPKKLNAQDYMGACCRIRLVAEQILKHVDSVIVVDGGDQVLMDDIARLWSHFKAFSPEQYAGFAVEPPGSRWYQRLADRTHPNGDKNGYWEGVWPHGLSVAEEERNRGINAGVQLLNLTRMRAANTHEKFVKLAEEGTSKGMMLFGHLGDQDIWNFHLIREPDVAYKLPCNWNAQLGGSKHGWPGHCMPMKIMHANARSFKETESNRMQADGSITTTKLQPHELAPFQEFWAKPEANDLISFHFERRPPEQVHTYVNAHPVKAHQPAPTGRRRIRDEM